MDAWRQCQLQFAMTTIAVIFQKGGYLIELKTQENFLYNVVSWLSY